MPTKFKYFLSFPLFPRTNFNLAVYEIIFEQKLTRNEFNPKRLLLLNKQESKSLRDNWRALKGIQEQMLAAAAMVVILVVLLVKLI